MKPNLSRIFRLKSTGAKLWLSLVLFTAIIDLTLVAKATEPLETEFGAAVQLAPFVVKGRQLSISIHARTEPDRRYAEKFAKEVVEIAYETLDDSTGNGLVIIGREGEPHPVAVIRKFLALAAAGSLDPAVAARTGELIAQIEDWKAMFRLDEAHQPEGEGFKLTFDLLVPALPLPLEGLGSKLYQLSWVENFDDARIEKKLRSLTPADLEDDELSRYDWVFYLPPRNSFNPVMKEVMKEAIRREKIGLLKRAAMRSALVVFKPVLKSMVEAMRKGALFMTVLRAESDYSKDDIMALTHAYSKVLMPDFKLNGGSTHRRALEAIEAQKLSNIEYAKDPFVSPPRLTEFDREAYAPFEGGYIRDKEGKVIWTLQRKDDGYVWPYRKSDCSPRLFYPAGERLLVSADGRMTIEFLVDDKGAVTAVEERWHRGRQVFPRKT